MFQLIKIVNVFVNSEVYFTFFLSILAKFSELSLIGTAFSSIQGIA